MPATATDRIDGLTTSVAVKAPCKVASTANITLSGPQTISGVAVVAGDRVLVTAQTNAVDNGIWVVQAGTWKRAKDFDGQRDVVQGTMVLVGPQDSARRFYGVITPNPIVIGTTEIEFDEFDPTEEQLRVDLADTTNPANGAALVANAAIRVDDITALRALPPPSRKTLVYVEGYYSPNDGGGGAFLWVPASTQTDNGGTVIRPNSLPVNGRWERGPGQVIDARWFGARLDGVTDDRARLVAADAVGEVKIQRLARVSSSMTFTRPVHFEGDGGITADAGALITFSNDIEAGFERQLFYGDGSYAGIKQCRVAWFAGDKINVVTNALTEIQKALDACEPGAVVLWPLGNLYINGDVAARVSKGQKIEGFGKDFSNLVMLSNTRNGITIDTTGAASVRCLQIRGGDDSVIPVAGAALHVMAEYVTLNDFRVAGGYEGLKFSGNGNAAKVSQFELLDSFNIGLSLGGVIDNYFSQFLIVATGDFVILSGVTGTFVAGQTVTGGTSGATGQITAVPAANTLRVYFSTINPVVGETLTSSGGASGTVTQHTANHQLGGIRLQDKCEAIIVSDGDVIGGRFAMTTDAAEFGPGTRPAYNKFSNVYFDSADEGCIFNNSVEFDFNACWFSSRPNHGATLYTVHNFKFNGGGAINCFKIGMLIEAGAVGTQFTNFTAAGNSGETANTFSGLTFSAGVTDFIVTNCRLGGTLGFGTQRHGVAVNAGASDRYVIAQNLIGGNGTSGVSDGGTGTNKLVANNY